MHVSMVLLYLREMVWGLALHKGPNSSHPGLDMSRIGGVFALGTLLRREGGYLDPSLLYCVS